MRIQILREFVELVLFRPEPVRRLSNPLHPVGIGEREGSHDDSLEWHVKDLVVRSGLGHSGNPGRIGRRPALRRLVRVVVAKPRSQINKDGVSAEILPAGSMIGHQDLAYVIDQAGHVRQELNTDPGPGTTATKSSFAVLLADAARQALRSS